MKNKLAEGPTSPRIDSASRIPLRLLMAEDLDDDAVLVLEALERQGYDAQCTRVTTDEGFRNALEEAEFEIILCDDAMPGFDALAALEILRDSGKDVPLVIVSGNVGEALAVEAMRLGASDYLLKDNLIRLGATVERELREADIRRQKRLFDSFSQGQTEVLEMILKGVPLVRILDHLIGRVEMLSNDEIRCSVMLVNAEGTHLYFGAGANVPDEFKDMCGMVRIVDGFGTCPTAVARGEIVIVEDIATNPAWSSLRDVALKYKLCSCWATPIFSAGRSVLGTMSVYHQGPHSPSTEEIRWVDSASKLASIAIERSRAAELLANNAMLLRIASEAANLGGWTVEVPENRVTWSDQVCAIHEMPPGSSPTLAEALEFYLPEWRPVISRIFESCLADGLRFDEEMEIVTARGRRIWIRTIGERIQDESGVTQRIQGAFQDITEKKQAQADAERISARMASTLESITDAFFTVDRDWRFIYLNHKAGQFLQRDRGGLVGKVIWDEFPDLKESAIGREYRRAAEENRPVDLVEFHENSGRWLEIRAYPSAEGLAVYFYDVTERRKSQEQLTLLESCVSRINDMVIITEALPISEPGPRIVYVNDAFVRHTGYTRDEVIGKSPRFLQGPDTQSEHLKLIRSAIENSMPVRTELINYKKSGERMWLEIDIVPVSDTDGTITHLIAVERDVTRRKLTEETARANELRYLQQRNALISLTRNSTTDRQDSHAAFRQITETTARTLNCARVGIWRFTEDRSAIKCMDLFQQKSGIHLSEEVVSASGFPAYFKALEEGVLITADEACDNPQTCELTESYLKPLGITSMLDVPIHSGKSVGHVICCEHIGSPRQWTADEKTFAFAIGNLVSLTLESCERALAQHEVMLSHQRFQSVAAATNDTIWDWNLETDAFWWSDGHARLFGWETLEAVATIQVWIRQIHPEDRTRVVNGVYTAIQRGDTHWSDEYRFTRNEGAVSHVLDRAEVIRDADGKAVRMVGGMTDLTAHKVAEQELRRTHRALQMLSSCNEMLIRTSEEADLLAEACRIAVEIGGYRMAWVGYAMDNVYRQILPVAHAGEEQGYLSDIEISWSDDLPTGVGPAGQAVRSGKVVVFEDIFSNPSFQNWLAPARQRGYRGVICLPLHDSKRVFGVLCLYVAEPHPVSADEIKLLEQMADDLAFGIDNARSREERQRTEEVVVKVAQAVSSGVGSEFFDLLTRNMVEALGGHGGLIGRYDADGNNVTTLSFVLDGEFMDAVTYSLVGTPCEKVMDGDFCIYEQRVQQLFPEDHMLADLGIEAYAGIPLNDQSGRVAGIMVVFFAAPLIDTALVHSTLRIFAARAAAELDRQQSDARIREQASLLDKAQDAILVRDLEHEVTYWNKSAERLYGWTAEEAIGRTIQELLYRDDSAFSEAHRQTLQNGEWIGEMHQIDKHGRDITVEGRWTLVRDKNGNPVSVFVINTDITEHRRLEQQFLRAQRLESIGTLAGGIAHDINNILSPISMAIELLKMRVEDERSTELLNTIASSARRGADMVGQVLSFARGMEGRRVEVHPRPLIQEIENILRDTFLAGVEMEVNVGRDLGTIHGDPTQIHQVILNLCVNARDAVEHGGKIFVVGKNVQIDSTFATMNLEANEGPHVCIEVRDNGKGIPPEIMDRIFDPFFTTKSIGKGTGLGLSTSLAIVKSHGGFIRASSVLGEGSLFRVYFPACQKPGDARDPTTRSELPTGNGETVLIVDDEASIRQIAQQTLEAFGYRALLAKDGRDALSQYEANPSAIDVVLTDMMMPVMDGSETIRRLMEINPAVRIIAASGIASNEALAYQSGIGVKDFLQKPYTAESLLNSLRFVIEA